MQNYASAYQPIETPFRVTWLMEKKNHLIHAMNNYVKLSHIEKYEILGGILKWFGSLSLMIANF